MATGSLQTETTKTTRTGTNEFTRLGTGPKKAAGKGVRVPPQNLLAEESLLGAMLLTREALAVAFDIVDADHFHRPAHAELFRAMHSRYVNGEPVDAITISAALDGSETLEALGGLDGLHALQVRTPAASNAASYAQIVRGTYILRTLIETADVIAERAYENPEDVTETVDWAENLVYQISQDRLGNFTKPINEVLHDAFTRIEAMYAAETPITGVSSGYTDLDQHLHGLQESSLYIVGARPGMGKSSFALGMVHHAAFVDQKPVLLFSLEMSHFEIAQRLLSSEAKVELQRLRSGQVTESEWGSLTAAVGKMESAPLWIDDNPNLTVTEIRGRARRLASDKDVGALGLIVIDYLQLMTGRRSADNRQVEVAEISRSLKVLAREMKCPVVALSQLSRNLEQRRSRRPQLADLRESGAIEQDADVVLLISSTDSPDEDDAPQALQDEAEIIIAKNRHGPLETVRLAFVRRFTKFDNIPGTNTPYDDMAPDEDM